MKIKKGFFSTEIDIRPGELREFMNMEPRSLFQGLLRWLEKYLDFKPVFENKEKKHDK